MPKQMLRIGLLPLLLLVFSLPARATLSSDLHNLVTGLDGFNTQLASISIDGSGSCSQLGTLNTSLEDYTASIDMLTGQLTAPLSLTADDMTSLDDLSGLSRSLAGEALRLSWELRDIEDVKDLMEYRNGLSAMLRLSDDVGTMANRILEMADRILAMADNIGTMADRILVTQQLQNSNITLTQAALLTTQSNMVQMSDSLSSIGYNLTLGMLNDETQALVSDMSSVVLTETNMALELSALEATTSQLLSRAVDLYTGAVLDSQHASHYINGDTLTLLGDLSNIHKALAAALDGYARTIEQLAPVTDNAILGEATASMLRLTRDIGLMSDRIMEMTDKIIVMSDNIGIMADRIVETQNIQQTNVLLTESSLLAAQSTVINTLKIAGL
jgi:hypothetical protein